MTIREAMNSAAIEYRDFYATLRDADIGCWDEINSTEVIQDYCNKMIRQRTPVSHIVAALEQDDPETKDWKIWLGDSMETPEPIWDKVGLVDALELDDEELEQEYPVEDEDDEEDSAE